MKKTTLQFQEILVRESSVPHLRMQGWLRPSSLFAQWLPSQQRGKIFRRGNNTIQRVISLVAISVITALFIVVNIYQPLSAQSSGTVDPLSADEIQQTLAAALQAGVANGADSEISAAAIDQEILLVERHRGIKSEIQSASIIRQGDVYVYDYTTNTLKHAVVNLVTGETSVIEETQYVQLPLTENEVQRALDLAFANESLRTELQNSYQLISGNALTSIEQLNVKAFVFLAESMPDSVNELSEQCGLHRCAQLLLYTDGDTVLEIQPIVDLSRQIVTQDITNMTTLVTDDTLIADENIAEGTAGLNDPSPSDALALISPDDILITNENIEESTADLSSLNDPNPPDALALISPNDILITNENIEESTADLSNQPDALTVINPEDQTQRLFLPVVGRNAFKVERASFEQQLMDWWCAIFGDTMIDDWFNNVCEL